MNRIIFIIFSLMFMFVHTAVADETIKVLLMDNPYDPFPSEEAEKLYSLNGKVFMNGKSYEGSFDVISDKNGLYVVKNLPFEKYIEGVVLSELGNEKDLEPLKAQAVISRTYAAFHKSQNIHKYFDISSSVRHQLYEGENTSPLISYVVQATEGEILTFDDLPVNAVFHATCEGKTELPEEIWEASYPYLKSVDCKSKNAPYEKWEKRFSINKLTDGLGIKGLRNIFISSYTATGRVKMLKAGIVSGKSEQEIIEIRATDLRKLLGYKNLPSTDFSLNRDGDTFVFRGKGYGHAVGFSQWGGLAMAKEGKNYTEILAHFYPSTRLKNNKDLQLHAFKSEH